MQVLIICLEADGDIDLGWWVALLPLWLYVTMQCGFSQLAMATGMSLKAKKTHKVRGVCEPQRPSSQLAPRRTQQLNACP